MYRHHTENLNEIVNKKLKRAVGTNKIDVFNRPNRKMCTKIYYFYNFLTLHGPKVSSKA